MVVLYILVVFLSFLSLDLLSLANGTPLFTNCPSSVCLSQPDSYECSVDTTGGADTLRWRVFDTNNSQIGVTSFDKDETVPAMSAIGSNFTATLTASSGPIVSELSFTPSLSISNYTVECISRGSGSDIGISCDILIADIPSAPVPNDPDFTPDTLNFSWFPSRPCVSHYNVNVTSIEYTINTNDTSLSLPVPSTNDTEYSVSVVAVDTGGRYMDPVGERTFVADVPDFVTDLMLNQTGLSINVSWDEPPTLMFLPVLSYTLHHNVTSGASITILAPNTSSIIPSVVAGSVYTVGVQASNALGVGPIASAEIMIISTSTTEVSSATISFLTISTSSLTSTGIISTSVSPTTTSMSMAMTPSVTSSPPVVTSTSTSTQSTPATTPTTSSPSAGGLDSTVYIGIGVGVAVLFIIILILIVVGYLVWRKSKGEKANFDQRRDSTEPIALVDKKDHGSSPATGQPIYQEAISSEDIKREAAPTTGELYAQPTKGSVRRPPPQPQPELATYQDPSTIQRTQAPNMEYLYAEVDKSKPQQQQAVYAQVDKEKKGGDGTVYADLDLKNTHAGPVAGNNPSNVIYSDVHNN